MQKYKRYPEYDLTLAPFLLKKKTLKKLSKKDVLLLGLNSLDLYLMQGGVFYAKLAFEQYAETLKLNIVSLKVNTDMAYDSKKYEILYPSLGKVQSRQISLGHKVEISTQDVSDVTLFSEQGKVVKGRLVIVEDELAIAITEVV